MRRVSWLFAFSLAAAAILPAAWACDGEGPSGHTIDDVRADAMSRYEAEDYDVFVNLMEAVAGVSGDGVDRYNLACGYALDQQPERALAVLTELVQQGADWDFAADDDFASLRSRPEFYQLIARAKFHEEADRRLEPVRDMAMAHYKAGNYATFVQIMERVAEYSNSDRDLYNLACGYALTNQLDQALGALERLADRGADFGAADDSDFASLHDDPRFAAVLQRLDG
ncbi:MAG: hypothetical protein R3F59_27140 [Myxococcota bacterium]